MDNKPFRMLAVTPYEGLKLLIERISSEEFPQFVIDYAVGNHDDGVREANRYDINGYDVILSRGGTAALLRKVTEVPVIDISITTIDIIAAWRLAGSISENLAVVGHENIVDHVNVLKEILKWDKLRVCEYSLPEGHRRTEALKKLLLELKEEGIQTVLGDTTAATTAMQVGLNSVMVTSSEHSVRMGLSAAQRFCEERRKLQNQTAFLDEILSLYPAPIAVFNNVPELIYANRTGSDPELRKMLENEITWGRGASNYRAAVSVGNNDFSMAFSSFSYSGEDYSIFYALRQNPLPDSIAHAVRFVSLGASRRLTAESYYSMLQISADISSLILRLGKEKRPILISSERGMEIDSLLAFLHTSPPFDNGPLVIVDCAVSPITEDFLEGLAKMSESELFSKGALICFKRAEKIVPAGAERLCRAINTAAPKTSRFIFQFEDAGSADPGVIACRKILERELYAGTFRLKPLREIRQEIPALVSSTISRINQGSETPIQVVEDGALDELRRFHWSGNLQQLRKTLSQLAFEGGRQIISADDVREVLKREQDIDEPVNYTPEADGYVAIKGSLEEMTAEIARAVLKATGGNQTQAARKLGISRTTLWRLLKK